MADCGGTGRVGRRLCPGCVKCTFAPGAPTSPRDARVAARRRLGHAETRAAELRVLNAAAGLDPADRSLPAEQIRQTAQGIHDDYDPAERDRVIWGG